MNMKSSDIKIWIKRNLYQISFNAIFLIMFISGYENLGDSMTSIIITGFVTFFIINIYSVINCFKSVRVLNTIKREDLNRNEKKKSTIAASIMFFVVGLSMFVLWVNRNALGIESTVLIFAIVAIVSGNAYIVFEYALKKTALRRKLERGYN